jgi:hypothetical protein
VSSSNWTSVICVLLKSISLRYFPKPSSN